MFSILIFNEYSERIVSLKQGIHGQKSINVNRLSSIRECNDPQLTDKDYYGNGLLNYAERSFCIDGNCKDIPVCSVNTGTSEEKYYVPLVGNSNIAKELVKVKLHYYNRYNECNCETHGLLVTFCKVISDTVKLTKRNALSSKWYADTYYDAVRLIQKPNGLFLKLNDATFARNDCKNKCGDFPTRTIPFTMANTCVQSTPITSTADLRRSLIKFSLSILPYH